MCLGAIFDYLNLKHLFYLNILPLFKEFFSQGERQYFVIGSPLVLYSRLPQSFNPSILKLFIKACTRADSRYIF
jgi:hypothetical protein